MLSAEDFASVKVAVGLCNGSELKEEILPAMNNNYSKICELTDQWYKNIEKTTSDLLENLGLRNFLKEKVFGFVLLIAKRMLMWAKYHEYFLGIPRDFTIDFFKCSLFTSRGIIDNKRAAEELMNCGKLNGQQRYKLACLYCYDDQILVLFKNMSKMYQKKFYNSQAPEKIKQPQLIKFWSYYVMGEVDKLRGEQSVGQYLLYVAVESGSMAAVEYCLCRTDVSQKEATLMNAALMTVKNRLKRSAKIQLYWVGRSDCRLIIPKDNFVDILCFLLDRMTVTQQIEFLSKDLRENENDHKNSIFHIVLNYFLDWPYQDYFMKTAKLLWEDLILWEFGNLLVVICRKIEYESKYVSFNYRKLLYQFWCESPQSCKKIFRYGVVIGDFLLKLFSFKNYTYEDRKNIEIIFESATDEEKKDIIFSHSGADMCYGLMGKEKWSRLDLFASCCCSSPEQESEFKREFCYSKRAQSICVNFVMKEKLDAAESFLRWSTLSEEEIINLKREMIYSVVSKEACLHFISENSVISANMFCSWFIFSEEELKEFKEELIDSNIGMKTCYDLILESKFEVVDEYIRWSISNEEEQKGFKRCFAYRYGDKICFELISNGENFRAKKSPIDYCKNCLTSSRLKGNVRNVSGPFWECVNMFLTWSFSSEEEINEFKRNQLLQSNASNIHFIFIKKNKWEEAKDFLSWLNLSFDETRELKRRTIFSKMKIIPEPFLFWAEGDNWEALELVLRWCLIDYETTLEFKDLYDAKYGFKHYENEGKKISKIRKSKLKKVYLLIDELLEDLSHVSEKELSTLMDELPAAKRLRST